MSLTLKKGGTRTYGNRVYLPSVAHHGDPGSLLGQSL
jgi:hypothetical protein